MKEESKRLFEYRIRYNEGAYHSALDSFHYYQAYTARQALGFHISMMKKNRLVCQIISVEEKCPWSKKWTRQDILNNEN
jgi:hypothetical protein